MLYCLIKPMYSKVLVLIKRSKNINTKAESHRLIAKAGSQKEKRSSQNLNLEILGHGTKL